MHKCILLQESLTENLNTWTTIFCACASAQLLSCQVIWIWADHRSTIFKFWCGIFWVLVPSSCSSCKFMRNTWHMVSVITHTNKKKAWMYHNLMQNIMAWVPYCGEPKPKEQQHSWIVHDEVLILYLIYSLYSRYRYICLSYSPNHHFMQIKCYNQLWNLWKWRIMPCVRC